MVSLMVFSSRGCALVGSRVSKSTGLSANSGLSECILYCEKRASSSTDGGER